MDIASGHAVANAVGALGAGLLIWLVVDVYLNSKKARGTSQPPELPGG